VDDRQRCEERPRIAVDLTFDIAGYKQRSARPSAASIAPIKSAAWARRVPAASLPCRF
jgi:hypothetical protein